MSQPTDLHIRPRRLASGLPDPLPRHWHGGNAFRSHLFNAMSVLFPDGERFFIDSVRLFREQVTDDELKEQIRGFIGQEGHHSREHLEYSQRLRELGYDIDAIERRLKRRLAFIQRHLPDRLQLAATDTAWAVAMKRTALVIAELGVVAFTGLAGGWMLAVDILPAIGVAALVYYPVMNLCVERRPIIGSVRALTRSPQPPVHVESPEYSEMEQHVRMVQPAN